MLPKKAWINITERCNNKCKWCYGKNSFSGIEDMSYGQAVQILEWLKVINCNECILIGGEPTIHPEFYEIFRYGNDLGLNVAVVTNGRMFSKKDFCEKMKSVGLDSGRIAFSMSSYSNESSELLTGSKENFNQFSLGFTNLINLGIIPSVDIVLSKYTELKIDMMIRWIVSHGGRSVTINLNVPAISSGSVDTSYCIPPKLLAQKAFQTYLFTKKLGLKIKLLFNIPFCLLPEDEIKCLLDDNAILSGCGIRNGSFVIFNVNGDIISCNHLTFLPVYNFQKVEVVMKDNKFEDFWNTDLTIKSIQKATCVYRSNLCKSCKYWNLCAGGCPLIWAGYDPKDYIEGMRIH